MNRLPPVVAALALSACSPPSHSNPYDPSTPPAQQARARLSGLVTLEAGAAAPVLSGVHVSIPGTSLSADTDSAGAYAIAGVPPGSWSVQAVRAGWEDGLVTGLVVQLDDGGRDVAVPTLALKLARGQVAGSVSLEHENTSGGVSVSLSGIPGSVLTDLAGGFLVAGVPVGTYTLTASKVGFKDTSVASVQVQAGQPTVLPTLPIPYDPGGFSGAVLVVGAASSGGVTVRASGTTLNGTPYEATTLNRPDGTYLISGLPAGSYTVDFELASHAVVSTAGTVAPGQVTALPPLSLVRDAGTVAGAVDLSAGAAAGFPVGADRSGAVVTLTAPDGTARSTVTDAGGSYRFEGVPVSLSGAPHGVEARRPSYVAASGSVIVLAHATAAAPTLTLAVDVGALSGTVALWDNVGGAGANPTSAGATVSLVGTAFNGAGWSASTTTAADGGFTAGNLPPGSYDVAANSAGRTCGSFARATVTPGAAASAGSVECVDAVAPTAVSLGAPLAPAGGLAGYTPGSSVVVPIALQASDATSPQANLRGYQVVVGSAADFGQATLVAGSPATLTFDGLAPNAVNLLWVRAVDWTGNAGPVASAQVVQDGLAPPAPTIATPRPAVDATTTSVTLSGSEADANFGGYEICTSSQAATSACPAIPPGTCPWTGTSPSFALSLPANQRTCLFARAWDRAGTRSAASSLGVAGVVSDLVPPTPPGFTPSFDPQVVTVRAPWVDFFLAAASTDAPAGSGPFGQVAWIEVDSGAGFQPLCPADACHPGGTYAPCAAGCGCGDARLLCDGTRFAGVRVPLLEGSANGVAFRAVDMAGNVGSGVGQQVNADTSGDLLAGDVALEGNPVVRGNLVTFHSWVPGVGNPHGVIYDLGADRRGQASDTRCDVPGYVASGYGRGIVPASASLVLVADNTAKMIRPGINRVFCGGDDVITTFYTPPPNYYVRGVSGAGEVGAWFEDYYDAAIANVYVREPGVDGTFGTGDDPVTKLGSYNYVTSITVGDRATLVRHADCGSGCYDFRWRVYNANAAGGYTNGVSSIDLPATATDAALSPDGRQLAWYEAGALWVRTSGPNGAFDAADDATASAAVPPAWGLIPGANGDSSVAVDGTHVVMLGNSSTIRWVVHWWAGSDGTFGTADDTLDRIHPSAGMWGIASLASSYAVFAEGDDIRAIDLSYLRWEATPQAGLSAGQALAADGRGHLIYRTGTYELRARSPAGGDTAEATPFYGVSSLDALGTDLLTAEYNQLVVRNPGASGAWFSAGAPAPVAVYTGGTSSYFSSLALGGGKGIATEVVGSNAARFRILEPRSGTLATLPTTGAVVDALGIDQGWADAAGITARQAFFTCHGISTDLCVRNAGLDGFFGTADDGAIATLMHPTGSPRMGSPVQDARAFRVSGRRMLLAEFSPSALYLFDAGADGLFGTGDDRGRKLADGYFTPWNIALAGDYAAYVTEGSPMGPQVYLVRDFDGIPTPITSYYSPKASVALEPSGRLFWVDSVFAPVAVFVRAP